MRLLSSATLIAATVVGLLSTPGVAAAQELDAPYARAAAVVNADGSLVRSKGVISVTRVSTGAYCVLLEDARIDANDTAPIATARAGATWTVIIRTPADECPNTTRYVEVVGHYQGSRANVPFVVVVP